MLQVPINSNDNNNNNKNNNNNDSRPLLGISFRCNIAACCRFPSIAMIMILADCKVGTKSESFLTQSTMFLKSTPLCVDRQKMGKIFTLLPKFGFWAGAEGKIYKVNLLRSKAASGRVVARIQPALESVSGVIL